MPVRYLAALVASLFFVLSSNAQKKNAAYRYHIHKATSPVTIDGVENDPVWKESETAEDFFMVLPMDTSRADVKTAVKMTYDNENIYIIATCYHLLPGPFMVESLRRDFSFVKNDNFIFFIDTFEDQTNGFTFGANAAGAQWDGMMYEGGKVDLAWDNKWYSETKMYDDRYVFEAAIPFKTIRYKKGITEWGINFSRNDLKTTEKSSWAPVPRQFPTASLAYTGVLVWDQPPPETVTNLSIIPFALGRGTKDYENNKPVEYVGAAGADAKIGVTSSLNLDLTVHPDFSQVDVDVQVTNLSRFELFFPERRQFFLENGDLFANYGYATIRPFFSRRIGLGVPIQYGARLSGKINRNWRLGVMDMRTGPVESSALPGQNFGVVCVQRRIFARSNIGFMLINKQSINYTPGTDPTVPTYSQYNRTAGMEYNLASSNNVLTGKVLALKSLTPGKNGNDGVLAGHLQYASRIWTLFLQAEDVAKNFNAEVGYVPRTGYIRLNPLISRLYFPRGAGVLSHGPQLTSSLFFNNAFAPTDNETKASYLITFRSRSTLNFWGSHSYVKLLAPFDPTNSGQDSLAKGTRHFYNAYGFDYVSKPQSVLTYALSIRNGGYYDNGSLFNMVASLGYRYQPYAAITMTATYNNFWLPDLSGETKFWLIGPRVDVTLTNKLFITGFLQYNDQKDNVNLNARFQWRYKPASDFYLVYTDNYLPTNFAVKNRALVFKFTYWWSI